MAETRRRNPVRAHGEIIDREPTLPPMSPVGFIQPPLGYVLLVAVRRMNVQALLRLGDGSAEVTPDSYGGLTMEPRPDLPALLGWEGGTPTGVSIPFTIGSKRRPNGKRTERTIRDLEKLAAQGGKYAPPPLIVDGARAVPHDYTQAPHVRWRIESLEWNAGAVSRGAEGRRVFTAGELVVRQNVQDETLAGLSPAIARNQRDRDEKEGTLRGNVYAAKDGDTLRKIAKRFNFTRAEITDMKRENGIRDPDAKLKAGRKIRLPRRQATFG